MTTDRRRFVAWAGLVPTALLAGLISLRWVDTAAARVPVVQAAFPLLGFASVVWAGLSLLMWRRDLVRALPAVGVALLPLALVVPTMRDRAVDPSPDDEVVAASNLEFGEADAAALLARVRTLEVDTLVLTELTPEAAAALDRHGARDLLPHRVGRPQPRAEGTVILSRHRLTAVQSEHVPGLFDQPVATVHAVGGEYTLRAVHPYPPTAGLVRAWHRQLGQATEWVAAQPPETPLVLAGDFNSSRGHPAFRRLARGFEDAHHASGSGWVRTWPREGPIPAFVQLDHVLVRRAEVAGAGTSVLPGTDHSMVWARLRLGSADDTQG